MSESLDAFLDALIRDIRGHGAVDNPFFRRWRERPLGATGFALFKRNYREWVWQFPRALAALAAQPLNEIARAETARTLLSETGNGRPEKSHGVLFDAFVGPLAATVYAASGKDEAPSVPLLEATQALVRIERELYGGENLAAALGAQLALEWQAYDMLVQLYEGARLYARHWPSLRAFHEAAEYFHVHLAEAEKEHQEESLAALRTVLCTDEDLAAARAAAKAHLDVIESFWLELYEGVSASEPGTHPGSGDA